MSMFFAVFFLIVASFMAGYSWRDRCYGGAWMFALSAVSTAGWIVIEAAK